MIFEQIKQQLTKKASSIYKDKSRGTQFVSLDDAVAAVEEIRTMLSDGHFGCNSNGEHEKCDGCGLYATCPDYNKHWFQRAFPPKEHNPLNDQWIPCKYHEPKVYDKYLVTCEDIEIPQIRLFEGYWDSMSPVIAWQPLPERYRGGSNVVNDGLCEFERHVNYLKSKTAYSDTQIGCFLCNYNNPHVCGRFTSGGCKNLVACKALYTVQAALEKEQQKEVTD